MTTETLTSLVDWIKQKNEQFNKVIDEANKKLQNFKETVEEVGTATTEAFEGIATVGKYFVDTASEAEEFRKVLDVSWGELAGISGLWTLYTYLVKIRNEITGLGKDINSTTLEQVETEISNKVDKIEDIAEQITSMNIEETISGLISNKVQDWTNSFTTGISNAVTKAKSFLAGLTNIADQMVSINIEETISESISNKLKDWVSSFTDSIINSIVTESFLDMLTNIAAQIASMIGGLTNIVTQIISMIMQTILTPINYLFSGLGLPFAHTGGLVTVNGIEGFRKSGMTGTGALRSDEKLVKTKVGEIILNEDQQKGLINTQRMGSATQANVNVEVINNTGTPIKTRKEVQFDGTRTIVKMFMDGYARNMEGIQDIFKRR